MADFSLKKHPDFKGIDGPLLLVILDGVGLYRGSADGYEGNAVDLANTPNLDALLVDAPVRTQLMAHGPAVGLPSSGDMGNSEVGHNAIGAGRVFAQGAKLVNKAIESGRLFEGQAFKEVVDNVKRNDSTVHLIGLLSDGNVHSHIDQLFGLLDGLCAAGVSRIRVHPLADGRDVEPISYHLYLEKLQFKLNDLCNEGADACVASGGGRMKITMDRYEASWAQVKRGWDVHVLGKGETFKGPLEAVQALRTQNPGIIDQDLPGYVIVDDDNQPVGAIEDGDSVIFFNFRGDRAIEISRAFTEKDFDKFDRERVPDVTFAGMMEYDGDLHIPPRYLVEPPEISRTMSEYLAKNGVAQFACAETQKYGHVTYFWNGNNSGKFNEELETWKQIPSDDVPFEQTPKMKAYEVCDATIEALKSGQYRFLRVNFANGDMVGHTGVLQAAVDAMSAVDECLGKIQQAVAEVGGTLVVTADHGNSEQMLEVDKKTGQVKLDDEGKPSRKTSHTLNPVPWTLSGADATRFDLNPDAENPGLGNIAATLLTLMGFEPPKDYLPSIIRLKR